MKDAEFDLFTNGVIDKVTKRLKKKRKKVNEILQGEAEKIEQEKQQEKEIEA
ncbi:MAG: hypothetical protein HZA82_07720 [Thaumarchaeota archaeon]|nr:hypothetical protein [Nitrososphaerota archaeon]